VLVVGIPRRDEREVFQSETFLGDRLT
jgi:hypothetical protein